MSGFEWRQVPIGLDPHRSVAHGDCQTVLVIVHSVTSGQRLRDAVRLLASDERLQIVFTIAPDVFNIGVEQYLADIGGIVVPWHQATQLEFELALTTSYDVMRDVHAPLIVMPHGIGFHRTARRAGRAVGGGVVYGPDPQHLIREGRVPAAIVLPHAADRERLARAWPEALPAGVVVGDPDHDRLVASLPLRAFYRRAFGVSQDQKLVVVTSAWGPRSLFGTRGDLISLLLTGLPREEYRVLALCSPDLWSECSCWQVHTRTADHLRAGLSLLPLGADWRAALTAADWIIGDHRSVALYGAVTGVPILLSDFPIRDVAPSSAMAELAKIAPQLSRHHSLPKQLSKVMADYEPDRYRKVAERITSTPGNFNRNMRRLMYRLIGLPQPATIPAADPVSPPFLCD